MAPAAAVAPTFTPVAISLPGAGQTAAPDLPSAAQPSERTVEQTASHAPAPMHLVISSVAEAVGPQGAGRPGMAPANVAEASPPAGRLGGVSAFPGLVAPSLPAPGPFVLTASGAQLSPDRVLFATAPRADSGQQQGSGSLVLLSGDDLLLGGMTSPGSRDLAADLVRNAGTAGSRQGDVVPAVPAPSWPGSSRGELEGHVLPLSLEGARDACFADGLWDTVLPGEGSSAAEQTTASGSAAAPSALAAVLAGVWLGALRDERSEDRERRRSLSR
jgi:hypothetical protein